jgi:hypothetical protein
LAGVGTTPVIGAVWPLVPQVSCGASAGGVDDELATQSPASRSLT